MRHLLWLPMLLPMLLVAGVVYQWLGALRDRRRFLPRGRLIDIGGGRRLYCCQKGTDGPTVIFESGIAATSQNWYSVQEAVSGFARAVVYDRGGLGWSSACGSERIPSNIACELRVMLRQAGIEPPYLLVGHSFGGLIVRRYAADYPDEVTGVVLVDAMRSEEWPPVNEERRAHLDRGIRLSAIGAILARFGVARLVATSLLCRSGRISGAASRAGGAGGLHVLDRITCEVGKMPRKVWPVVAAHWSSPYYYRGLVAHLQAVPASVREMHHAAPIDDIPVLLLTPGRSEPLSMEALGRIGLHTRQVIAAKSGHWIHLDEPHLVIDAIRSMVEDSRLPIPEEVVSTLRRDACL